MGIRILSRSFVPVLVLLVSGCTTPASTANEEPAPPIRVLILGDSISMAYNPLVRKKLGERAIVMRPMRGDGTRAENCEGTTKGIVQVDRWLTMDGGEFDVIHFNFGLHDVKRIDPVSGKGSNDPGDPHQATLEVYSLQLEQITSKLQASEARLIFATTTPVPGGRVRPHRDPEDVVRYNAAAVALMKERGIQVNDLHAFVLPRLEEFQRPVNVHFTPAGSDALADEVVAAILVSATVR